MSKPWKRTAIVAGMVAWIWLIAFLGLRGETVAWIIGVGLTVPVGMLSAALWARYG